MLLFAWCSCRYKQVGETLSVFVSYSDISVAVRSLIFAPFTVQSAVARTTHMMIHMAKTQKCWQSLNVMPPGRVAELGVT
jgi:hypothetical protein